jgi:hypothetical protein
MIGIIIAVVIGILVIGVLFKLLKLALIVAVVVGAGMFILNKVGTKRIK